MLLLTSKEELNIKNNAIYVHFFIEGLGIYV